MTFSPILECPTRFTDLPFAKFKIHYITNTNSFPPTVVCGSSQWRKGLVGLSQTKNTSCIRENLDVGHWHCKIKSSTKSKQRGEKVTHCATCRGVKRTKDVKHPEIANLRGILNGLVKILQLQMTCSPIWIQSRDPSVEPDSQTIGIYCTQVVSSCKTFTERKSHLAVPWFRKCKPC